MQRVGAGGAHSGGAWFRRNDRFRPNPGVDHGAVEVLVRWFARILSALVGSILGAAAGFWLAMRLGGLLSATEAGGYVGLLIAIILLPLCAILIGGAAALLVAGAVKSRSASGR